LNSTHTAEFDNFCFLLLTRCRFSTKKLKHHHVPLNPGEGTPLSHSTFDVPLRFFIKFPVEGEHEKPLLKAEA